MRRQLDEGDWCHWSISPIGDGPEVLAASHWALAKVGGDVDTVIEVDVALEVAVLTGGRVNASGEVELAAGSTQRTFVYQPMITHPVSTLP